MVSKTIQLIWIVLCLAISMNIQAETKLNASVDRNKIYENDTLNLTIAGEVDMEFSFGGLMNFGRNQISAPELSELLTDFEILDQNQNYSMRSINGETKAQVTWNYSLAPKRTGTLTIPPVTYQGGTSNEIKVTVEAGKAPRNADTPPMVFIEAEVDKQSAYVQEQVLYTLRLYAADHLATGELSEPAPNDAIVEAIGDTKKYYRMAYNQRYEVRERKYLLFPQKSGELTIEPQSFNGMLIDTRTRRRMRVRETSDAISLDIKAPPASFSGELWLPATSFEMTEKWDKEPYGLKVGDSVTRTIEMTALGLLGSALPPVQIQDFDGLKIYPDQPLVESYEHDSGAQSVRNETAALVAIDATEVTLPEINIPWWDTVNDVERTAIIPARTFTIAVNPEQTQNTVATPVQALTSSNPEEPPIPDEAIAKPVPQQIIVQEPNNHPWYLIIALLTLGWVSTTWLLIKRQQALLKNRTEIYDQDTTAHEQLTKAIKSNSLEIPKYLIAWANEIDPNMQIESITDLKQIDEEIYLVAKSIEEQLYGPNATGAKLSIDSKNLLGLIKKHTKSGNKKADSSVLQPMYP